MMCHVEQKPMRVQLKRTKGYRMPPNSRKVDRSTRWGNPFNATQVGVVFFHKGLPAPIVHLNTEPSVERCIDMFIGYLKYRLEVDSDFLDPLQGKNLACWCPLDQPCHADVLLRLANETIKEDGPE